MAHPKGLEPPSIHLRCYRLEVGPDTDAKFGGPFNVIAQDSHGTRDRTRTYSWVSPIAYEATPLAIWIHARGSLFIHAKVA